MENCVKRSKKLCAQCKYYDYCDRASRCDGKCYDCDDNGCENNPVNKKPSTKKVDAQISARVHTRHKPNERTQRQRYIFNSRLCIPQVLRREYKFVFTCLRGKDERADHARSAKTSEAYAIQKSYGGLKLICLNTFTGRKRNGIS